MITPSLKAKQNKILQFQDDRIYSFSIACKLSGTYESVTLQIVKRLSRRDKLLTILSLYDTALFRIYEETRDYFFYLLQTPGIGLVTLNSRQDL